MNIIEIANADIDAAIIERLKPIATARIESEQLHNIPDVEQFFQDMTAEGVGDAAIIVAAHVAKQGIPYGITAVRPLRHWAAQYRPDLLDT